MRHSPMEIQQQLLKFQSSWTIQSVSEPNCSIGNL